ncbi:MAG: SemiSWEET transporter [Bacteroidota bacterium]
MWTELIGTLAGICTTGAVIPQIYKTWKTRKSADISPVMYVVMITGAVLWTTYGVLNDDLPIIIFNGITVVLNSTILVLYYRYADQENG